jgi:hypothetical protein
MPHMKRRADLAVEAVAQHVGLRIPMITAALMLTIVWFAVMRRRKEIAAAFSAGPYAA